MTARCLTRFPSTGTRSHATCSPSWRSSCRNPRWRTGSRWARNSWNSWAMWSSKSSSCPMSFRYFPSECGGYEVSSPLWADRICLETLFLSLNAKNLTKKPQTLNKCIALSALFSDISFLCATAGTHCSFLTKTHHLFATNTKGIRWCSRQSSSTPYYCKKRKALIGIGRRPQPSHTQKSHRHIKKLKTNSKYFSLFTALIWSICNEFICVSSCVRR